MEWDILSIDISILEISNQACWVQSLQFHSVLINLVYILCWELEVCSCQWRKGAVCCPPASNAALFAPTLFLKVPWPTRSSILWVSVGKREESGMSCFAKPTLLAVLWIQSIIFLVEITMITLNGWRSF